MNRSYINICIGIFVSVWALFGVIDHASDVHQSYQEAQVTPRVKSFMNSYINEFDAALATKQEINASSLVKIDSFEQEVSNRAYVITERSLQKMQSVIKRARFEMPNVRTEPVSAYTDWAEVIYTMICIFVLIAGALLCSNLRYRFVTIIAVLAASVIFDILMLATESYSVYGVSIMINVFIGLCIIIVNRNLFSNTVSQITDSRFDEECR